jgi:hypothetical protein
MRFMRPRQSGGATAVGSCTTYIGYFKVLFEELAQDTVCASLVRVKIRTLNLAYTKEE